MADQPNIENPAVAAAPVQNAVAVVEPPAFVEYTSQVASREVILDTLPTLVGNVGHSISLRGWSDAMFFREQVPTVKFSTPSSTALRSAGMKIGQLFSGGNNYDQSYLDMRIILLAMKVPKTSTPLFAEWINEGGPAPTASAGQAPARISPDMARFQYAATTAQVNEGMLAHQLEVAEMPQPAVNQYLPPSSSSIESFWTSMSTTLMGMNDAEAVSPEAIQAINILGYLCLNCFKLMVKEANQVYVSMNRNIDRHFKAFYGTDHVQGSIPPIAFRTLTDLKGNFSRASKEGTGLFAMIIARYIIEETRTPSSQETIGVLMASCLIHTSLNGLPLVKYFEQCIILTKQSVNRFISNIYTTATEESCGRYTQLIRETEQSQRVEHVAFNGVVRAQSSWRWSRVFENRYFTDFSADKNLLVLMRLACIIAKFQEDQGVLNIAILRKPAYARLKAASHEFADRFIEIFGIQPVAEVGITEGARSVLGGRAQEPDNNNDQWGINE